MHYLLKMCLSRSTVQQPFTTSELLSRTQHDSHICNRLDCKVITQTPTVPRQVRTNGEAQISFISEVPQSEVPMIGSEAVLPLLHNLHSSQKTLSLAPKTPYHSPTPPCPITPSQCRPTSVGRTRGEIGPPLIGRIRSRVNPIFKVQDSSDDDTIRRTHPLIASAPLHAH